MRSAHRGLLLALRPNAVALVDAFAHPDYLLNSALGREVGHSSIRHRGSACLMARVLGRITRVLL